MEGVEEGVGGGDAGVEELRAWRGVEGAVGGGELEEEGGEVEAVDGGVEELAGRCEAASGAEEGCCHGGFGGESGSSRARHWH